MTLYMIIWSVLIGSLCILLLHILLMNTSFLVRFGLGFFTLTSLLCIFRILTPVEIPSLQHKIELPYALSLLIPRQYQFHSTGFVLYILIALSLTVSALFLARFFFRLHRSLSALSKHSKESEEGMEILRGIDPACNIKVHSTLLVDSPIIVGYLHPTIYLNEFPYSQEDLKNIIFHEYQHWKHGHLFIKLFVHVIRLLFWWNPLVILLEKDVSHLMELMCDEYIYNHYDSDEQLNYAGTIILCLDNLEKKSKRTLSPSSYMGFAFGGSGTLTAQRFVYHLNHENHVSTKQYIFVGIISAVAILCLMTSYYYIIQPVYQPDDADIYSNENNSYLVEQADGSYIFYFDEYTDVVPAEEVENGSYYIYTIIPYDEYKNLSDYTESDTYKEFISKNSLQ